MQTRSLLAIVLATFAVSAVAADRLEIPGADSAHYLLAPHHDRIASASDVDLVVTPVGSGQAVLDVIEGRAQVAVVTESFADAVADARLAKWTGEHRLLLVSRSLTYYPIAAASADARPLAFVTMSAPSPQLTRLIQYLNSDAGARSLGR
jgi:hypothetical protein